MEKMKLYGWCALFGLVLNLVSYPAQAMTTADEAILIGTNFIKLTRSQWEKDSEVYIEDCVPFSPEGRLLGYVLDVHPGGFIFVSLLEQMSAVKAYSTRARLDVHGSEGFAVVLKDAVGSVFDELEAEFGNLETAEKQGLLDDIAPPENKANRSKLLSRDSKSVTENEIITVGPLLETEWGQDGPYNQLCPAGSNGRTTVVGCVATAAAQIMKYWEWPDAGTGSHTYSWYGDYSCEDSDTSEGAYLTADFSDAYDWDNMLDSYDGGYTTTEADAVAELSYEVGVAFEMNYGVCNSTSWTHMGQYVYPTYFRYKDSITNYYRYSYGSAEEWFDKIRNELDADPPRPIHYSISGHSIVCDGYQIVDDLNQIHLNYGWNGFSTGIFFTVDKLYCTWDGCSYEVEAMLCGIEPADSLSAPSLVAPEDGAVLDNGCEDFESLLNWEFDWSDVPGATHYQLYVKNKYAEIPVVNTIVSASHYSRSETAYVSETNLYDWRWKVRAGDGDGEWSEWSDVRYFDVEDLNLDCETVNHTLAPPHDRTLSHGEFCGPIILDHVNNSGSHTGFTIYTYITLPDGKTKHGFVRKAVMSSGETDTRRIFIRIPDSAPTGTHTFGIMILGGGSDEDLSFQFSVSSSDSSATQSLEADESASDDTGGWEIFQTE